MDKRTLVIHGGFAKTGTSALQVGFARNRELLLANGVDYLQSGHFDAGLRGAVSSGNAVRLGYHLSRLEEDPGAITDLVAQLAASGAPNVLVSSEFFQSARRLQLQETVDAARAAGFEVRAVFLVRAYYDWLWSAYVQNVKNHAVTATFAEWAKAAGLAHMFTATLDLYDAVLGPDNVQVVNYDGIRPNLLPEFLRLVFGIDPAGVDLAIPSEINRSLTAAELALLRRFNALRESEADGTLLSNLLITASPRERAAMELDGEVLRWLEKEVRDDIARLNRRVAGGAVGMTAAAAAVAAKAQQNVDRPVVLLLLQTFALLVDTRRELDHLRAAHFALAARTPPPPADAEIP